MFYFHQLCLLSVNLNSHDVARQALQILVAIDVRLGTIHRLYVAMFSGSFMSLF